MQPQSSADPTSPRNGGIIRAVGNGTNSIFRGAISEGYQQAAEGLYNMLGSMLGRNPHSNTSTPDLRIHLRIAEQKLAVEEAAIKARLKRQPRGFAPPPDYGKLKDTVRSITDELNSRHGSGESFIHSLRSFVESTQEEAARQRQVTRDFFDVDDDFANSAAGNILEGIGSLATLPLNASVAGLPVTIAQTYQGGYDDYVQSRERQGLPVNRDEAERAAATYLATVGPAEALLDKFVVGRILSSMKGKATVGQTLAKLTTAGVAGGATNAADQAYINALAKHLQGYDLERTLDQGVLESFAFGTVLSGAGGHKRHPAEPDGSYINFDPETSPRTSTHDLAARPRSEESTRFGDLLNSSHHTEPSFGATITIPGKPSSASVTRAKETTSRTSPVTEKKNPHLPQLIGEAAAAPIGSYDNNPDSFQLHQARQAVAREMKLMKKRLRETRYKSHFYRRRRPENRPRRCRKPRLSFSGTGAHQRRIAQHGIRPSTWNENKANYR
jgi:hypothetical protein